MRNSTKDQNVIEGNTLLALHHKPNQAHGLLRDDNEFLFPIHEKEKKTIKLSIAKKETESKATKKLSVFQSAFIGVLGLVIFTIVAETYAMYFLENSLNIPDSITDFLDPVLLSVLMIPLIYYMVYKPAKDKIIELEKIQKELHNNIKNFSDYKYALDESSIVNIVDENGNIKYVNDNFCKISKYSREELIGKKHQLLNKNYHSKDFVKDLLENTTKGNIWRKEIKEKAKDGTYFWVDTTIVPFLKENGDPFQYMVIKSDITAKKETEEKLKYSESRLKQAQEIAHVGSWEVNFETGIAIWSEETCRIYGLSQDDNIQSFEIWQSFIYPDDFAEVMKTVNGSYENSEDFKVNHRILLKDGMTKHVYEESKYEFDDNGKPIGLYGIAYDVTEKKKSDDELLANNKELKKINAELDRFVYSISHELRSPLTSIMGLHPLIEQSNLDEENKRILNYINRSVFKMDDTLKDILDFSRNARKEIKYEKTDLNKIIKDAFEIDVNLSSALPFVKKINIKEDAPFYSDTTRIKIIINNIISNALKYGITNNGYSCIEINGCINDKSMTLAISDNGIGISQKHISDVFKMFHRATVISSGTGLGLYITKECVERLKGTIQVESEFGKGTKFIIEIPNNKELIN